MKTTDEMDAAIMEAHHIRSRHDGVHAIHSYVAALELCRQLTRQGPWAPYIDAMFEDALAKVRFVQRNGFAPKPTVLPKPPQDRNLRQYAPTLGMVRH